MYFTRRLMLAY